MSLHDLKVGDRVQVFDTNGSRMGQPRGGWDGTVAKVGRKLITVRCGYHYEKAFRLDSGQANDGYGHQYIKAPQQVAEDMRRDDLTDRLRALGLEVRMGYGLSTSQLEAVVQVLEAK